MNPGAVGSIVFLCTFVGALFGMWLNSVLPEHHLAAESRDTVKVGIGLIATMTALVLGLVTASAKSSFDAVNTAVKQSSVDILVLDRVLARYGAETNEIRQDLKSLIGERIEMVWPQDSSRPAHLDPIRSGTGSTAERLADAIITLKPQNDLQRGLQSRAVVLTETLLQARWVVLADRYSSVPAPFLAILFCWLTITFASFGLYAPRNATVVVVLFVCSLSVCSAVFLVLEMDAPFDGLIKVSDASWRYAYAHLNH